jgi:hypothetical protein
MKQEGLIGTIVLSGCSILMMSNICTASVGEHATIYMETANGI